MLNVVSVSVDSLLDAGTAEIVWRGVIDFERIPRLFKHFFRLATYAVVQIIMCVY